MYVDKLINENESREVDEDEKVPPRRKRWGSRAENREKQVRYFCYDYISKENAQDQCVGIPIFARYAGRIMELLTVQTPRAASPKEGRKTP